MKYIVKQKYCNNTYEFYGVGVFKHKLLNRLTQLYWTDFHIIVIASFKSISKYSCLNGTWDDVVSYCTSHEDAKLFIVLILHSMGCNLIMMYKILPLGNSCLFPSFWAFKWIMWSCR